MATKLAEFEVYQCPEHGVFLTAWEEDSAGRPHCPIVEEPEFQCWERCWEALDGPYKAIMEIADAKD